MNSKTAHILNHFATKTNISQKDVKKLWYDTPANKRGDLKQKMLAELNKDSKYEVVSEDGEQFLVSK